MKPRNSERNSPQRVPLCENTRPDARSTTLSPLELLGRGVLRSVCAIATTASPACRSSASRNTPRLFGRRRGAGD